MGDRRPSVSTKESLPVSHHEAMGTAPWECRILRILGAYCAV